MRQTVLPVTLIVPTYNESDSIADFLEQWTKSPIRPKRLLIMDDSIDDTPQVVERFHRRHSWIECHRGAVRRGLSGSVIEGVKLTQTDWVSVMDSDGQHPISAWCAGAQQCRDGVDLILMNRTTRWGRIVNMSWSRSLVSQTTRWLAKILLPSARQTHDPLSGFFFCRTAIWPLSGSSAGWKILLDVLVKAQWQSAVEVNYEFQPRTAGVSKASLKVGQQYLLEVFRLFVWQHKHHRQPWPKSVRRIS